MKTTTATGLLRTLLGVRAVMGAFGAEVRIKSVDEFIQFKDNVNKGNNYSGTTVFLDSDIDFTDKTFEPIGTLYSNFYGAFDGQGYVISNLEVTSSSLQHAGLFGYPGGLIVKNIILDSSCSITSSYNTFDWAYVGGIVGYCDANNGPCTIENSVNMGSVSFNGKIDFGSLLLGGIAGRFDSSKDYESTLKNCANYGEITHSGTSDYSHIGGVVGYSYGSSASKRAYIYNCFNNGTIIHSGTTTWELYLGGIAGYSLSHASIENCVSGGRNLIPRSTIDSMTIIIIGGILGHVDFNTTVNYCYFANHSRNYKKYGEGVSSSESNIFKYDIATFELNGNVSIGSYTGNSLIDVLNAYSDYYTLRDYSHWLLNKDNKTVSFIINERSNSIDMDYRIILLPSLASEGKLRFDGWYEDRELTKPLASYEISSDTELYGRYCIIIVVTLNVNGGDELDKKEMTIGCDRVYEDLPEVKRTGHTFLGWFTEKDGRGELATSKMTVKTTHDHTLHAHWIINNYTITFNFNNGDENEARPLKFNETITYPADPVKIGYSFTGWSLRPERMPTENLIITAQWSANKYTVTFNGNEGNISHSTKTVTFDSPYGELPTPSRTEAVFLGWFNEINESVTADTIVRTPNNHTLYARWAINRYTLTFILDNKTEVRVLGFNASIEYPENVKKEGYTFNGWNPNSLIFMPANDTTIAGIWSPNKYTVILNASKEHFSQSTQVVTFDSPYGVLPMINKTGATFLGWFNEMNERVTADTIVKTPNNHTLYAHWLEEPSPDPDPRSSSTHTNRTVVPTKQVEVIFNQKGMTGEDVEEIIKKYTNATFVITVTETSTEEIRVVINFGDTEKAKEFVETVESSSEAKATIAKVGYIQGDNGSFSTTCLPLKLLFI